MITKTINYENFNGEQVTETLYFNFTKAEFMELELTTPGGYVKRLEAAVANKEPEELTKLFKELLIKAYGIKSEDGKRFVKTPQIQEDFMHSEAYSEVFVELLSNADAASLFMEGVLPKTK